MVGFCHCAVENPWQTECELRMINYILDTTYGVKTDRIVLYISATKVAMAWRLAVYNTSSAIYICT